MDLDLCGDMQFGRVQLQQTVQPAEDQDGDDDGKIADEGTELEDKQGEQGRGRCAKVPPGADEEISGGGGQQGSVASSGQI